MPIDLMKLPAHEAERLAHAEGFKGTAELFARIADLERKLNDSKCQIESLEMVIKRTHAYGDHA